MSQVVVIGAGAAGLMAAITAAKNGHSVTILEKNERIGKKLFITGKGRCNVTNACDGEEFMKQIMRNHKFMYSSFHGFDNWQVYGFFEDLGVPLKIERGNRVFPESDHSYDIIDALRNACKMYKVNICLNTKVKSILQQDGCAIGVETAQGKKIKADYVILSTGGCSYPTTGSSGDGYKMAASLGHTIITPTPSLVPFNTKEEWCRDLMGLSLRNITVTILCKQKKIYHEFGELLFTHFGVSGPLILSASCLELSKEDYPLQLFIDLKPALDLEQLDLRIQKDFQRYQNRHIEHGLDDLLPKKLIPIVLRIAGIDEKQKINSITKTQRLQLVKIIKALPLEITGTRDFNEAIITRGGISIKEVNPKTMESKCIKGLYFAGELLDVDAKTGGYNLQIAWSTGYAAGCLSAFDNKNPGRV